MTDSLNYLKIVTISDTHGQHESLDIPDGDILIHSGDITQKGKLSELEGIDCFFKSLPHKYKILIAGNHDFCFQKAPIESRSKLKNCIYLEDEGIQIEGINFYGSPWQPWFYDWAFNLKRGAEIKHKWGLIPAETDVLITHGPPLGYGDLTSRGESVGCEDLLNSVTQLKPKFHIFGHIHEGYGVSQNEHTKFINASSCTLRYQAVNKPIVFNCKRRLKSLPVGGVFW